MSLLFDIVRRQTGLRRASSFIVVALAFLASGQAFAQPAPAGETRTIERRSVVTQADQDARKFRTREQRMQEKPLDWNTTIGTPSPPAVAPPADTSPRAEPGTAQGGAPNADADNEARRAFPNEWRATPRPGRRSFLDLLDHGPSEGGIQLTAGSPDIYTQYCENCPAVNGNAPRAIGKLFTNAGTCSASVISGNNVIVTAAHCCWNRRTTNTWIGGWSFAPAYNNGYAPYSTFPWVSATVLNSWINNGDIASDLCAIKLGNNSAGRSVTYYTGWLGRSWDWPSDQEHHVLGYPGNLGGGNTLQLCTSESFSPSAACGGAGVLVTGCSMTHGSSGGPWVRSYRGSNWVNSVVHGYDSTTCTGTFGQTFNGARFTSGNIVLVCNAQGC
jgi:V8-like Glu-specific endopeptidase